MTSNILFSGLPESGKTTFIAAMWFYIFYGSEDSNFTYGDLEDAEMEYLNSLSQEWASCKQVMRTSQNIIEQVSIPLLNKTDGQIIKLSIPDISGETFRSQFLTREWDDDFDKLLEDISGIIMFIDPRDEKNMPRLIFQENQHHRIFGDVLKNDNRETPWTEDLVPSQVKLVDFLQMVDYHKSGNQKISIIVSCWDLVKGGLTPEEWCAINTPLLYQYIVSNDSIYKTKFFGVSSQGGNYDTRRAELLKIQPLQRIIVTDGQTNSNNILDPIIWITDNDKN